MFSGLPPEIYIIITTAITIFLIYKAIKFYLRNIQVSILLTIFGLSSAFATSWKIMQTFYQTYIGWIEILGNASIVMGFLGTLLVFLLDFRESPKKGRFVSWQLFVVFLVIGVFIFLTIKY